MELNVHFLGEALCQASELCAAAGEENTVLHDIGIELGRSGFKHVHYGRFQLGDGFVEAVGNLLIGDGGIYRMGCHHVRAAYHIGLRFNLKVREHGTDGNLDSLGSSFSDFEVVLLAHVVLYVGGEYIAGNTDTFLLYYASEGDDCDFSRAASDIHYHVALRSLDVEADTES